MYKVVIIGGGIQGCTVAAHLLHFNKVSKDELLIIDRFEQPLNKWKSISKRIGMTYLRSPSVHHLDPDPYSLKKYAKVNDFAGAFLGHYGRPRLDMFNQHCEDIIERKELIDCWRQGMVTGLERAKGAWKVSIDQLKIVEAESVVLAMGMNDRPCFPKWTESILREHPHRIQHIFSEEIDEQQESFAVIGGGITAAHLVKTLTTRYLKPVTLIKRHPYRTADLDSDPGWLGPKYLTTFHQSKCYIERRSLINEARNRGSITKGLRSELKSLELSGKLDVKTDEVKKVRSTNSHVKIYLKAHKPVTVSKLILATGTEASLPGGKWLAETIARCGLPLAPCGFPIVNNDLEWMEGLYVTGALAELEIGPVARNIAGARKAAERIVNNFENYYEKS
ncbi:FAD/NAD(P)-binding protein [Halobacillus sp. Marseille-P3879]|uniref:FAD/NAD(P)-binding protein n=1 Tax=Halobacillus sp. Marseille-P3879 TaxID=2045014 RepID=UPI000C7DE2D4|nr:FAD/NAD(P)-binding protein [Halobacillus sp. Marseille-P3879]